MNEMQPVPEQKESKGPLVGTIIVILVIIIGGVYVLFLRPETITPKTTGDVATDELLDQGTSTELSEIEKDLEETNLNDLDKELSDIETELDSIL